MGKVVTVPAYLKYCVSTFLSLLLRRSIAAKQKMSIQMTCLRDSGRLLNAHLSVFAMLFGWTKLHNLLVVVICLKRL